MTIDFINSTISIESSSIQKPSFSKPLVVGYHTKNVDRVRSYSSLTELESDGFAATDAIHKAVAAVFAQSPTVASVAVGRLALAPTTRVELTPTAANSTTYKVAVNGTEFTYASDASATVAEICTGLVAAIGTVSGVTVTDETTLVRLVASSAGNRLEVDNTMDDLSLLSVAVNHADPGIATDMAAILNADQSWYTVTPTTSSEAELNALSAWCLSNGKIMIAASQETAIITNSTSDIASDLEGLDNERAALMFHPRASQYAGAAMAGVLLASDPGSMTLKFKPLAGVSVYNLTTTQLGYAKAKNCNTYQNVAGQKMVREGTTSKTNRFVDFRRDLDWLEATIETDMASLLARLPKVPFTDAGIAQASSALRGALTKGQQAGVLDPLTAFTITAPKVVDTSADDREARILRTLYWTARVAGAVHSITIRGSLSF